MKTEIEKKHTQEEYENFLNKCLSRALTMLPENMTGDFFKGAFALALVKNPKLRGCKPSSIAQALMTCAASGATPGVEANLIPYKDECQLIIDYKGFRQILARLGNVKSFFQNVVYENDGFTFEHGDNSRIHHKPTLQERGEIIAAYAILEYFKGGREFVVLTKEDIEKVRKNSPYGNSGPWVKNYPEMCMKTASRKLFKTADFSQAPEGLQAAMVADQDFPAYEIPKARMAVKVTDDLFEDAIAEPETEKKEK